MIKNEEKKVEFGDIIVTLTEAMQIVSKVAKSEGILSNDIVEDAKIIVDIFEDNFSEELLVN